MQAFPQKFKQIKIIKQKYELVSFHISLADVVVVVTPDLLGQQQRLLQGQRAVVGVVRHRREQSALGSTGTKPFGKSFGSEFKFLGQIFGHF